MNTTQWKRCAGCAKNLTNLPDTQRLQCSRCKAAYFCNKQCQRHAWPSHRQVCFDAQQAPLVPAGPSPDQQASEVFQELIRTEIQMQRPLVLVIMDRNNAADSMNIMDPRTVRQEMWDEINHEDRAEFELNCGRHADARGLENGNVHVVYLDARQKYFKSALVPVRPRPSSPLPPSETAVTETEIKVESSVRSPAPQSGGSPQRVTGVQVQLAQREQTPPQSPVRNAPASPMRGGGTGVPNMAELLTPENVIQMQLDEFSQHGPHARPMMIQYLRQVHDQAEQLFGQGPYADETVRRVREYAKGKLQEMGFSMDEGKNKK